ncbi:Uncharacterized protein APZ42_013958 [Daphnia magna]|uniref:AIG1-type G domain-containing protein n=1 Tax=Daphnia magna TaxID=35525 RepID=A0A162QBM1_9CRUS|nr:Uncharacterized protein APZ42_013958 [Daphnia magna]
MHLLYNPFELLLNVSVELKVHQMAEPIRISTLGRDAQVGDLYNYLTDVIVPSGIDVPNERKTISDTVGEPKLLFIYQQPEKSKRHFLGINSHLLQNMKRGSVPGHQLWFSDYLNTNSMDGDEGHAQVTLLFRVVRRTETLDLDFLRSKIDDYQLRSSAAGATHVIDEVVYGAEVICSMRKALDLSQETKESAEVSIYFAAKKYLDETIMKSSTAELPVELDQVSLTCLSSVEPGKKYNANFDSLNRYLQNLLDTENNRQKWKPMEFLLRNMSAAHIEAKLCSERKDDVALEKKHHQVNRKWITKEMLDISNDPSLKRFPLLEKFICYFRDLLPRFWKGIDETYKTLEMLTEEKVLEEMIYISDWLKKVMDLFACWRKDIREMCWLLKDTDLVLLEMQEIEAQMTTKDCKLAKLFVLNLEYKKVPIVNDIEELVGQQTSTVLLPVLPSFSYEKEHIGCIRSALSQFANEARLANLSSSFGTSYYVALDSSTLENGAIVTIDYSGKSPIVISEDNPVEYLKKKQKHQLLFSSSSVSAILPPPLTPTVVSNQNQQLKSVKDGEHSNTHSAGNCNVELLDHEQDKIGIDSFLSDVESSHENCSREETGSEKIKSSTKYSVETSITSKNQSKLIRTGLPNVYLLNAMEKSNSEKINWFDICRPRNSMRSRNPKNHKIIILIGTTGSGKSTLINGMINYILGVQWNDPFRFKCVREDENAARNQAHSQTSSVTAYTLQHQEGMTIPYSITIIDTPGYGDTRGVKRDKEITAAIHRFLTQQEIPIDEIHAACFVAASGDSRLTATQRYIIDSVLSIFGKDMKANLRLLVTFADNADPPVVGACLSANFPTTSASDGIAYSKFNSSVLYCSNAKQGDDEFSFDQLFWDMGHENFKKFFAMLERMNGRDLKSTREVIQSRRQVEQALVNIEQELEVCLVTIENMEIFQEKMKICGYNMEATKNYMVEHTVMRRQTSKCKNGFKAYNCRKCNVTCENNIKEKDPLHRSKRWCTKVLCECLDSDHQLDKWEWQLIPEKVTIPLLEMKAQYESNFDCKMNVEQLLNACGDNLLVAKTKVLSLLEQVAKNAQLLESTALRSNVLSPSDYLTLMRSRVLEEQAPGYSTRLHTLDELQQHLTYGTPLTAPKIVINSPQPTYDSYNTGGGLGGYQDGSQSSRSKNQTSQQMSSHYYGTTTATGQVSKKAEGEKTGKQSYFTFFGVKKK